MAHVPTEAEIDRMSEEEIETYLASAGSRPRTPEDTAGPSWLRATGASASYAWLLVVGSVIGIAASWELMSSEIGRAHV